MEIQTTETDIGNGITEVRSVLQYTSIINVDASLATKLPVPQMVIDHAKVINRVKIMHALYGQVRTDALAAYEAIRPLITRGDDWRAFQKAMAPLLEAGEELVQEEQK